MPHFVVKLHCYMQLAPLQLCKSCQTVLTLCCFCAQSVRGGAEARRGHRHRPPAAGMGSWGRWRAAGCGDEEGAGGCRPLAACLGEDARSGASGCRVQAAVRWGVGNGDWNLRFRSRYLYVGHCKWAGLMLPGPGFIGMVRMRVYPWVKS